MLLRNTTEIQRAIHLPATGDHVGTPPIVIPKNGEIDIDDELWISLKAKRVVRAWLDDGLIVEGGAPRPIASDNGAVGNRDSEGGDSIAVDMIAPPDIAEQMRELGMTVETISRAKPKDLTTLAGVGPAVAKRLIAAAQAALG